MRAANAILTESVKSLTAKKSSLEVALAAEVEERRKLAVAQADITDKVSRVSRSSFYRVAAGAQDQTVSLLLPLLFCGRSRQARGLSGGNP
jgi:hypothetical protein